MQSRAAKDDQEEAHADILTLCKKGATKQQTLFQALGEGTVNVERCERALERALNFYQDRCVNQLKVKKLQSCLDIPCYKHKMPPLADKALVLRMKADIAGIVGRGFCQIC